MSASNILSTKVFPCFNKFPSQLYQMTWYVHIGAALLDPSATVRYIGRCGKGQRGKGIEG